MKSGASFSPRLATRLLALSAVVLVVPWLGMQSLSAMKTFLIEGQQGAQLLTARGVASVLAQRPALFPKAPPPVVGTLALPLFPAYGHRLVDGYEDDWQQLTGFKQHFGEAQTPAAFSLLLAAQGRVLYGMVNVFDVTPVPHRPGVARLDRSDHVRLLFGRPGNERRLIVSFEGNGSASAFWVDSRWRYGQAGEALGVSAHVASHSDGYSLEFRVPLAWVGVENQFALAVVDVSAGVNPGIATVATNPGFAGGALNPVIVRSEAAEAILAGFSEGNARLWLLDTHRRVLALVGELQPEEAYPSPNPAPWWQQLFQHVTGALVGVRGGRFVDFDADSVHTRNDGIYQQALTGAAVASRRQSLDGRAEIITAAQPVEIEGAVVGVLLLEKSTAHILQLQRQSLETLVGLTVVGMALVSLVLLVFAFRLAWRIRRLGIDAAANVDERGRFVGPVTVRGVGASDEIGDLARIVDKMLARLSQHQNFLHNIPRTLRHEINNPLNTIATSLERLTQQLPESPHVQSAERGLVRIGHVVNTLAEAASLEQALQAEDLETVDLTALLRLYIAHQAPVQGIPIALTAPDDAILVRASGEHLEQLLDKLLDNARDFCQGFGSLAMPPIRVALTLEKGRAVITVTNLGPPIPAAALPGLFQFMASQRSDQSQGDHFGLGLYVVRVIAEHHGGEVIAGNLPDGSGVVFRVLLPVLRG